MGNLYPQLKNHAAWLFLFARVLAAAGCRGTVQRDPEVPIETQILWPIADVDDRSSSAGELELVKKVFVLGNEPTKEMLPRFTAFRYKGKKIVQSGDKAKVTVEFTDAKSGSAVGDLEWSLVKVNDVWRIKDAPLPAAVGK